MSGGIICEGCSKNAQRIRDCLGLLSGKTEHVAEFTERWKVFDAFKSEHSQELFCCAIEISASGCWFFLDDFYQV